MDQPCQPFTLVLARAAVLLFAILQSSLSYSQQIQAEPPIPLQKDFSVTKDKSTVFIYRNDMFLFGSRPISVFANGSLLGNLLGNSYVRVVMPPGKYTLSATALGGTGKLSLNAEKDKIHFVWLDAQSAFPYGPKPQLSLVDEQQGKKDLLKCGSCSEADGAVRDIEELGVGSKSGTDDVRGKLQALKKMFDESLISKDEYDAKRKQLLDAF